MECMYVYIEQTYFDIVYTWVYVCYTYLLIASLYEGIEKE